MAAGAVRRAADHRGGVPAVHAAPPRGRPLPVQVQLSEPTTCNCLCEGPCSLASVACLTRRLALLPTGKVRWQDSALGNLQCRPAYLLTFVCDASTGG